MAKNMKELLEILHANKEDEEEKPTKPTKKEKKTPTLKRNKKYKLSDSPDDVIDESSISLPGRVYIGWVNTKYFNYRRPIIISSNKKLVKYRIGT
jgi:hypothetical protein